MKRHVLSTVLVMAATFLVFPLAHGCTDLQAGQATVTTVVDSSTVVTGTAPTEAVSTTVLPPVATASTAHPPITSAATTTSTTLPGLHVNPGALQTNPTILKLDPNMMVNPTRYEDSHPFLHWEWEDAWKGQVGFPYSGGGQKSSKEYNSYVQVTFNGTGAQLIATKSSAAGRLIAHLSGPGVARNDVIELQSGVTKYRQNVWYSGYLAPGDYAVYFEWDPDNDVGQPVSIDAIDVWGTVTPP
jgi:hypothetical protein